MKETRHTETQAYIAGKSIDKGKLVSSYDIPNKERVKKKRLRRLYNAARSLFHRIKKSK